MSCGGAAAGSELPEQCDRMHEAPIAARRQGRARAQAEAGGVSHCCCVYASMASSEYCLFARARGCWLFHAWLVPSQPWWSATMRAQALARSQRCSSVNTVVPAIDDGLPALPGARAGRFGSRADALRGVGSSLGDPCRGANGGRDVGHGSLSLLFTGHPGPWPIAWPHQLLLRPKSQAVPGPPLCQPNANRCSHECRMTASARRRPPKHT